jgi:cell division inhibitor SepF
MFEKFAERLKEKSKGNDIPPFKDYDAKVAAQEAAPVKQEEPAPKVSGGLMADSRDGASNIELKVVRPESFAEVGTIADYLLENCTVVINFEGLDETSKLRMLDFLNGVTYSTDGEIKQVSQTTFVITPNNVDVSDEQ